jgi:hypothetical protein
MALLQTNMQNQRGVLDTLGTCEGTADTHQSPLRSADDECHGVNGWTYSHDRRRDEQAAPPFQLRVNIFEEKV